MSNSGQQHSKADVGGQRSPEPKSADHGKAASGATQKALDAGKKPAASTDAKK